MKTFSKFLCFLFPALVFLMPAELFGQIAYTGFVGKYPVKMVTDNYTDGVANAVYAYDKSDEPISLSGRKVKNKLTLVEKDKNGVIRATLLFNDYDSESENLIGVWTNVSRKEKLKIELKKDFEAKTGESAVYDDKEIIQAKSMPDRYFTTVVSKAAGDYYAHVRAVKIYEKKSDRLLQEIDLSGDESEPDKSSIIFRGSYSISIGDYNFDGVKDFSIFEANYAGPNTTSLYYLYDTKTKKFFDSGFNGISLEFDARKKLIFETNQCCAGAYLTTATYRLVNNKMVLIKERCYVWDEKKNMRVETKLKACR